MVFVHGFNERYDDTVYGFAQILHNSGALGEVAPVLFTWPSKGNIFAYGYDRESSNYSRDSLEALLRYLVKDPKVKKISILAHSMGNWLTLEALRQMAIRDGASPPRSNWFSSRIPMSMSTSPANRSRRWDLTARLFVSEDDQALAASKEVWGAPRLGAINPNIEPYKSMLERENITVINLTKLPSHDEFNHGEFAEDPKVIELIGRSLASGQALTYSRVGFGNHGERRNLRRSRRRPRGLGARRHCRSGDAGSLR